MLVAIVRCEKVMTRIELKHMSRSDYRFRYAMLILAIIIVSDIGVAKVSLARLAMNAVENLANVASVTAGVPPNQENTLAVAFADKEKELTAREAALIEKEATLDAKYQEEIAATKRNTFITILIAVFLLLALIVANFYYDVKREEEHERALIGKNDQPRPSP